MACIKLVIAALLMAAVVSAAPPEEAAMAEELPLNPAPGEVLKEGIAARAWCAKAGTKEVDSRNCRQYYQCGSVPKLYRCPPSAPYFSRWSKVCYKFTKACYEGINRPF